MRPFCVPSFNLIPVTNITTAGHRDQLNLSLPTHYHTVSSNTGLWLSVVHVFTVYLLINLYIYHIIIPMNDTWVV